MNDKRAALLSEAGQLWQLSDHGVVEVSRIDGEVMCFPADSSGTILSYAEVLGCRYPYPEETPDAYEFLRQEGYEIVDVIEEEEEEEAEEEVYPPVEYRIIAPVADNDGLEIPGILWENLEHKLLDLFGGFSRLESQGQWRSDDGIVYYDHNVIYSAIGPNDCFPKLLRIAEWVKAEWCQESIAILRSAARIDFV